MSDKDDDTNNKYMVISEKTLIEVKLARKELSVVEELLKLTIKDHASYVDKLGKKSTGAKGFAMQINTRIKKEFGRGRNSMTLDQMLLLKSLLVKLNSVISQGELESKTRKAIKNQAYQVIIDYGNLVGKIA